MSTRRRCLLQRIAFDKVDDIGDLFFGRCVTMAVGGLRLAFAGSLLWGPPAR